MTRPYDSVNRNVLPIADGTSGTATKYDVRDPATWYPPITPPKPPAGAPNVLIVLLDDVGFGATSAFGGPIATPNFDALANGGLRYIRFHTAGLRSPTRAALLTGRNHHAAGPVANASALSATRSRRRMRPNTSAPLADILRLNGYGTAQFGVERRRVSRQSDRIGTDPIDHAVRWIRKHRTRTPDRPFFVCIAPGASHSSEQLPAEWADRFAGKFDSGWCGLRAETFARQKQLGVIPDDCELPQCPDAIAAWDNVAPDMKAELTRQLECYAGLLAHTDHRVGLLIDALNARDILNDTLIYLIIGDSEASGEGAHSLAPGWAHAMNTPYRWTNQAALHWGGTRNGAIVHWPHGIVAQGEIRSQFHHVIDVAPTILEAAGIPQPTFVHGVRQRPIEGVSMMYSFDSADAMDRHETQYFEMFGNRGIYHRGWTAVTKHRTGWEQGAVTLPVFSADVWELYDTRRDWAQARDLAEDEQTKLLELQRVWLFEAVKYNVLPVEIHDVQESRPIPTEPWPSRAVASQ